MSTSSPVAPTSPSGAPPAVSARAGIGGRRIDASMTLLREVMEQPLDPAYQQAADRRVAGRPTPPRTRAGIVLVAVLCGWLVTQGVIELRRPEPGQAAGRAALEQEITRRTTEADARQRTIARLRAQITAAQQEQLTRSGDAELAARTAQLALVTGELPVTGPGLEITLKDAPSAADPSAAVDPRANVDTDEGRVLDRDLQVVVNGLWAAGGEAIAINGRRLTALSAIRSAGRAILVDFRPLLPPYVVQAIGDPARLQSGFASGSGGSYLQSLRQNYGVQVAITSAQRLDLPGAGSFALRQVRSDATATATATQSSAPPSRTPALPSSRTSSAAGSSPAPSSSEVGP